MSPARHWRPAVTFLLSIVLLLSILSLSACLDGGEEVEDFTLSEDPGSAPLRVTGRLFYDDGNSVEDASVKITVTDSAGESIAVTRQLPDWNGVSKKGLAAAEDKTTQTSDLIRAQQIATSPTDSAGRYRVGITEPDLEPPLTVLMEVTKEHESLPVTVTSSRQFVSNRITGDIQLTNFFIPSVSNSEIQITDKRDNSAQRNDVNVGNIPIEVDRLFMTRYDPGNSANTGEAGAFPGTFSENNLVQLNSSVFLWSYATDNNNARIERLSSPMRVRTTIDSHQWPDLTDLIPNTGRIEVPLYRFNEELNVWEQLENTGWLERTDGTVLLEEFELEITSRDFRGGNVHVIFDMEETGWIAVNYALRPPWRLSRLSPAKRLNTCFNNAMATAARILISEQGLIAISGLEVNSLSFASALNNGRGPEVLSAELTNRFARFKGNELRDRDDQVFLADRLWEICDEAATEEEEENAKLLIAATLINITAHWTWDTMRSNGNWVDPEPGGEAGHTIEKQLFGGVVDLNSSGQLTIGGEVIDAETRSQILNLDNWPLSDSEPVTFPADPIDGLELSLSLDKSTYDPTEEILATVELSNTSSEAIPVLNLKALEGYPLRFIIVPTNGNVRVPFRDNRDKLAIKWDTDIVSLAPGESIMQDIQLIRNPDTGLKRYNILTAGDYRVRAMYNDSLLLSEASSNIVEFTVNSGGSISGVVTDVSDGTPIFNARVRVYEDDTLLVIVASNRDGEFTIANIPPGTFSLETSAASFVNQEKEITIGAGDAGVVDFGLSTLLSEGEMRIVLSWQDTPLDLDSHLWLPPESPYHIYFNRLGSIIGCPFGRLIADRQAVSTDPEDDEAPLVGTEAMDVIPTGGTYMYAVHNWAGPEGDIKLSQATVQILSDNGSAATFSVPTEGSGRWWHVFNIDGETGAVTEINRLQETSPAPYLSTDTGCDESDN